MERRNCPSFLNRKCRVKGTIIQASKDKVKSFEEVQFRYIFRKTNTATYGIAQEGKLFKSARSWIEEAPLKVKQLVASL
ncbi:hypothetical protein Golax_000188, partial [Gossypium laxum]|nr:hypothetical protein [Gossypium laxum]